MTQIVGILNLTPDSFSGDGAMPEIAIAHIDALIEQGASVIDIGAESTRPGATVLSVQEEWQRLAPVAEAVSARKGKVIFSIDTHHAEVARKAIGSGFGWINDVSGGGDPKMMELVRETGCTVALMHSLSVPASSVLMLSSDDPMGEVVDWAEYQLDKWERAGVPRSHIILDPGIGFGKTPEQSLALITEIGRLKALGIPIMVGHSRKSFLSLFTNKKAAERDPETLAVSYYLAEQGVDYLRVHDVKSHIAMLRSRQTV